MKALLLDGKSVSHQLRQRIAEDVSVIKNTAAINIAAVSVGADNSSAVYFNSLKKACDSVGIGFSVFNLDIGTSRQRLLNLIRALNERSDITGILVSFPLPKHIDEEEVRTAIDPLKDIDAVNPFNTGKLVSGSALLLPCTPAGIMEILEHYKINAEGKECVIVGRSDIVGKPASLLMLREGATVTICHSKTKNLSEATRRADILVSAVGKAGFITGDMVKDGAVVIDVGINTGADGKLCGDVDFDAVCDIASYITPVPGGVGAMTVSMLLKNAVIASDLQRGRV